MAGQHPSRSWRLGLIAAPAMLAVALIGCTRDRNTNSDGGDQTPAASVVPLGATTDRTQGEPAGTVPISVRRPPEQVPVTIPPGGVVSAQLDDLIATTERLRGHPFADPPTVRFVLPAEMIRLRGFKPPVGQVTTPAEVSAALFDLLGVFSDRVDLGAFYEDFYSSATGAFYDVEYRELIVPLAGAALSPYEQWALVHELSHALTHQTFPAVVSAYQESSAALSDLSGALLGLIEGEAVLVQTLFFAELPPEVRQAIVEEADRRADPGFGDSPRYVQAVARFPYHQGVDFVLDLYGRGGMVALDQAFAFPPSTTRQIYHPDVFVAMLPATQIEIPAVRLPGYESASEGVWGELGWSALLGQFLNGGRTAEAAQGWSADRFEILWNPVRGDLVFIAEIAADSTRDGSELAGALGSYFDEALGMERRLVSDNSADWLGIGYAALQRSGSTVRLVVASNALAGLQAASQLGLIDSDFAPRPSGSLR